MNQIQNHHLGIDVGMFTESPEFFDCSSKYTSELLMNDPDKFISVLVNVNYENFRLNEEIKIMKKLQKEMLIEINQLKEDEKRLKNKLKSNKELSNKKNWT